MNKKLAAFLWGCRKKVRYTHAQTAQNVAQSMVARGLGNLIAYKCSHCDGWHVGNK